MVEDVTVTTRIFFETVAGKGTGNIEELPKQDAESIDFFQKWKILYLCLLKEESHREGTFCDPGE